MSDNGEINLLSSHGSTVETVGGLLDTQYLFEIPLNQRSLSWSGTDLKTVWVDLLDCANSGYPHFMGFMVFENRPRNGKPNLIVQDGQQRLMCLLSITGILYRSIKDDPDAAGEATSLRSWIERHGAPRLALDHHHGHLSKLLVNGTAEPHPGTEPKTAKKFRSAFASLEREIIAFTGKKTRPELQAWVRTFIRALQEDVYLISVTVNSPALALRVFDRLNARGVKLSQADIVKNMLYRAAHDQGQAEGEISTEWDRLVATVPFASITTYLRYWAQMADCKPYSEKELPNVLRSRIERDPLAFLQGLNVSARYLRDWWDCSQTSKHIDKTVAEHLELIGHPQLAYPMLWRASELHSEASITTAELSSLAKSVEHFVFRELVVMKKKTSDIELHLIASMQALFEHGFATSQKVLRDKSDDEEFTKHFSTWTVRRSKKQFYTLREIERFLGSSPGTSYVWKDDKRTRSWEVEHIYPQGSRSSSNSKGTTSHVLTVEVNRIGNLVLLERKLNNHVKDKSFEEKKKVYKSGFRTKRSSHARSQMVAVNGPVAEEVGKDRYQVLTAIKAKDFGDEQVKKRQSQLAALAPDIWQI